MPSRTQSSNRLLIQQKAKRGDLAREKQYKMTMEKNRSGALRRLNISIKVTLLGKKPVFIFTHNGSSVS